MRMKTCSNYQNTFKGNPENTTIEVAKPIKRKDHLKTEPVDFSLKSNYSRDFGNLKPYKKNPSIDDFTPKRYYTSSRGLKNKSKLMI